jgi:hypothetical protein
LVEVILEAVGLSVFDLDDDAWQAINVASVVLPTGLHSISLDTECA